MNPATSAEAQFRAAASKHRDFAKARTTEKENSIGGKGLEVQPEAAVSLRTAELFDKLADDMAAIGREHGRK